MEVVKRTQDPDRWIAQLFSAKAVEKGGVVRRSVVSVDREIGRARLMAEVDQRGFCLLEAGGQFVIICTRAPVRRLI